MSPHPSLAAVSAGIRAFDSWFLAFGLIDVVCLGPVSLSLGFCPFGLIDVCLVPVSLFSGLSSFGWIDVVCLGLSSAFSGCLSSASSVDFGVHVCVLGSLVCPGSGSVSAGLTLSPLYNAPPMVICSGSKFLW